MKRQRSYWRRLLVGSILMGIVAATWIKTSPPELATRADIQSGAATRAYP
jgi:hypothetical protein